MPTLTEGQEDTVATQTFERGLLEDLHGVQLVGVGRRHLAHQEHLRPQGRRGGGGGVRERKPTGSKLGRKQRADVGATLPKDPCPSTLSSSNWEASAFSEPSLTTWVMLISLMSPSSCENRKEKLIKKGRYGSTLGYFLLCFLFLSKERNYQRQREFFHGKLSNFKQLFARKKGGSADRERERAREKEKTECER